MPEGAYTAPSSLASLRLHFRDLERAQREERIEALKLEIERLETEHKMDLELCTCG